MKNSLSVAAFPAAFPATISVAFFLALSALSALSLAPPALAADTPYAGQQNRATREVVEAKAAEIGAAQARYRASHLVTHIEAARMMTAGQIAHYDRLRGYVNATAGRHDHAGHGSHSP